MRRFAAAFLSFSAANFNRPAALSAASANDLALVNCASSLLCLSMEGAANKLGALIFLRGLIGVANKLGVLIFLDLFDTRWTC